MALKYLSFLTLAVMLLACNNDIIDDNTTGSTTDSTQTDSKDYTSINEWIYEEMSTYYLWESKMPSVSSYPSTDPNAFFESLLYTDEDKWSYITDDYTSLVFELTREIP